MKKILSLLLISLVLSLATPFITNARDLTWTGAASGNWNDSANFSPMFVPTANDTVTIDAGTNHPQLTANVTLYRLVLLGDTFDLNGYQLNIANEAIFSGGWLVDGHLECRGTIATFAGTAIETTVEVDCTTLELNGSVFNQSCYFKAETGNCQGGNTFMAPVSLVHVGTVASISMAMGQGDTFHDTLYVTNNSDGNIYLTQSDTSYFKNCVRILSTGTGSIHFGSEGGISILETNGHLVVENGEFTAGQLFIKNIEQQNATRHRMVLTGTGSSDEHSLLALESCHFTGDVDFTSPNLLLSINRFDGEALFTKTGGYDNVSTGDNLFSTDASFTNSSATGHLLLTGSREDRFVGTAEFTSGSTKIIAGYGATTIFEGDVVVNASTVGFYRLKFTGEAEQTLSGTAGHLYGETELDKASGSVTATIPIAIDRRLTFTKGYLVTDSVNIVTFLASATASGATDSSFVSGPVKKVGNTAFEFPIGKEGAFRPIVMTAPSGTDYSFTSEYYFGSQTLGYQTDTVLQSVSHCNYWMFVRDNGDLDVSVTFPWDSSFCVTFDTTHLRLAFWTDSTWFDVGHGEINGDKFTGSLTMENNENYGYFTLGTTQASAPCGSTNYVWQDGTNTQWLGIGGLNMLPGEELTIYGTFTVNSNFFISGGTVKMDDDAKIIIDPNYTLRLTKTRLIPCNNYQWDYIKITGDQAELQVSMTHFIGADTAIWSNNGGIFTIGKGTFINRCWKGIMADAYANVHQGSAQSLWIGCATVPGGTVTANCFNPHSSVRTLHGIEILDVNQISIGPSQTAGINANGFFNLTKGIYARNSTLNVRNGFFDQINSNGICIHATSATNLHTLTVGGIVSNRCGFKSSTYGIVADNVSLVAHHNNMNLVNYGIYATAIVYRTVSLKSNEMNRFIKGISVFSKVQSDVELEYNNLNAPNNFSLPVEIPNYGIAGIEVHNAIGTMTDLRIYSNWITNSITGISLMNVINPELIPFIVQANTIQFQLSYADLFNNFNTMPHIGIIARNCSRGWLWTNNILRDFNSNITPTDLEYRKMCGIRGDFMHHGDVARNTINSMSMGVNFRKVCLNSFTRCNDYVECYSGVNLGDVNTTGLVGTSVSLSSQVGPFRRDMFIANSLNPAYTNRVFGLAASPINWIYLNGTTPSSPYYPNSTNSGNVNLASSSTFISCPSDQLSGTFDRENLIGPIVADTLDYYDFEVERRYYAIDFAYRCLFADTTRLRIDPEFDEPYIEFYDSLRESNIAKFIKIEEMMLNGEYGAAGDQLAEVNPGNTIEANKKLVFEVYLYAIQNSWELDSLQTESLLSVVGQCPMLGGTAVYEACAIMGTEVNDSCSNNNERLINQPESQSTSTKISGTNMFKVSPNPSQGCIAIRSDIQYYNNLSFKLTDITGRIVSQLSLSKQNSTWKLKLPDLTPGIYFYSIHDTGTIVGSGKHVIGK